MFFPDFHGSTLRGTDDGHREKEKFLVKLRRRLAAIFNDLEIEKFDLVALRHAFGTRARSCMSYEEAAACLGHVGQRTTSGYGKRNKRWKKSGESSGGWMPQPDPETVSRLEASFTDALESSPAAEQPEPTPS